MTDSCKGKEYDQLKRGAWTLEEDNILIHYINCHGDGRWNSLAKSAGLKRTGKSCRLRWLNYLKPDTKRGNLTPQEQLMILELHAKWGNRWSRIAHHLPGRTDNEIKNYWRTRVLKQARHLKIDSSSKRFVEALHRFWMPRLLEKVEQTSSSSILSNSTASTDLTIETDKKKSTEQAQLSPSQPNNIICASDSCWKMMLPQLNDQLSQLYAYNKLPFQNIDCNYNYIEATNELDFGSDSLNFHLADSNGIRTDGMAADTYWNMDELW